MIISTIVFLTDQLKIFYFQFSYTVLRQQKWSFPLPIFLLSQEAFYWWSKGKALLFSPSWLCSVRLIQEEVPESTTSAFDHAPGLITIRMWAEKRNWLHPGNWKGAERECCFTWWGYSALRFPALDWPSPGLAATEAFGSGPEGSHSCCHLAKTREAEQEKLRDCPPPRRCPCPQPARVTDYLHDRIHLLFQLPYLGHVLPHGLLQMQYAAALLLRIARDLKLEPDPLLLLTVLLKE